MSDGTEIPGAVAECAWVVRVDGRVVDRYTYAVEMGDAAAIAYGHRRVVQARAAGREGFDGELVEVSRG